MHGHHKTLFRFTGGRGIVRPQSRLKVERSFCVMKDKARRAHNFLNLTGRRFGKLTAMTVVKRPEKPKVAYWICRCDCGNTTEVFMGHLRSGHTTSCGCAKAEVNSEVHWKHGESKNLLNSREYAAWNKMKGRCYNASTVGWKYWGGKGITVCQRWLDSYSAFLEDMGRCPKGLTLERKDGNGNYEPGNCIWGTRYEQSNNRRNNVKITISGITKNLTQWAVDYKICKGTVWTRISRGWDKVVAVITPARIGNYRGKTRQTS